MLHQPFSRLAGLLILALLLSACGGPAAPVENTPSLPASAPQPSATLTAATPTAQPTPAPTPEPIPAGDTSDLLAQALAAGVVSEEEGLIAWLKALTGEADLPPYLAAETLSGEVMGMLARIQAYLQTGTNEAAKAEMLRLQALAFPSETDLLRYAEPASLARAPRHAVLRPQTASPCPNREEFICLRYAEFADRGFNYRVFYPRDADPRLGEWWLPYLDVTRDTLQRSLDRFSSLAPVGPVTIVFHPIPAVPGFTSYAAYPQTIHTAGTACPVFIYTTVATGHISPGDYAQVLAHEIFHCLQSYNFRSRAVTHYTSAAWWVESIAEYYSRKAIPGIDFEEGDLVRGFDAAIKYLPLTNWNLRYSNLVFMEYAGSELGDSGMLDLMSAMPEAAGEPAQRAAFAAFPSSQDLLHRFAQAYFENRVPGVRVHPTPMDTININGSATAAVEAPPLTVRSYVFNFAESQGFANVLVPDGAAGRSTVLPAGGSWGALPNVIGKQCQPRSYLFALTSTAAGSEPYRLAYNSSLTEESECNNSCLVGTWRADPMQYMMQIRAAFAPNSALDNNTGTIFALPYVERGYMDATFTETGKYILDMDVHGGFLSGMNDRPVFAAVLVSMTGGGVSSYTLSAPGVVNINTPAGGWGLKSKIDYVLNDGTKIENPADPIPTETAAVATSEYMCATGGLYLKSSVPKSPWIYYEKVAAP